MVAEKKQRVCVCQSNMDESHHGLGTKLLYNEINQRKSGERWRKLNHDPDTGGTQVADVGKLLFYCCLIIKYCV